MPKLFGRNYTKKQLRQRVGDMSQVAGARYTRLGEGIEAGADLIEVFNASGLCFSVLPGRSLDIAAAHYKGMSLCFRSGTGDVGPSFYEPQGFGWQRGFFGGLLTSCGLSFVGPPETDPEEEDAEQGLHGRLAFLPAKSVSAAADWEGEEYVVRLKGRMREAEVFGRNLEMRREISTALGHKSIVIRDTVENLAAEASPLMLVYHTNPGFPLLDAGSRLVLHSRKSTEWTEDREVGPEEYAVAKGPQAKMHDDVYVHRPVADKDGQVHVALVNDKLELGLYWRFDRRQIPIVNHWQHFHNNTYVTGIEPGNCSVLGRAWNRKNGTLEHIQPGEVREFELEMGVLDGAREIAAFERRVAKGVKGRR